MSEQVVNYRIKHEGMGWPVGAVVPAAAFRADPPTGHLSLGAVEPTTAAVTHPVDLPPEPATAAEEVAQNADLRARVVGLEATLAGERAEKAKLAAELGRVAAEAAEFRELAEQATAAARTQEHAAAQARLDAGPR